MDILTLIIEEAHSPALMQENDDQFVNKQLIVRTFDSADGEVFEQNFLPAGDRYAEVKLAGHTKQDPVYIKKVREYLDDTSIRKLLYCCRLSSYLGGPGFPDVLIFGHSLEFRYASEELRPEQILFLLLAKQLDLEGFGILHMIPEGQVPKERAIQIDIPSFVKTVLSSPRAKHYEKELQEVLWKEQEKLTLEKDEKKATQIRDEIAYLERQQAGMPFRLLREWSEGRMSVAEHWKRLETFVQQEEHVLRTCTERAREHPDFLALGKGMDDSSVEKRKLWVMESFGVGESHAERIVRRV